MIYQLLSILFTFRKCLHTTLLNLNNCIYLALHPLLCIYHLSQICLWFVSQLPLYYSIFFVHLAQWHCKFKSRSKFRCFLSKPTQFLLHQVTLCVLYMEPHCVRDGENDREHLVECISNIWLQSPTGKLNSG